MSFFKYRRDDFRQIPVQQLRAGAGHELMSSQYGVDWYGAIPIEDVAIGEYGVVTVTYTLPRGACVKSNDHILVVVESGMRGFVVRVHHTFSYDELVYIKK